jgi:hypothetical protein
MTFLNPLLLVGLLGMAVPVLIHLLSRRTARQVEFSSLDFLRRLERRSLRRVRIRQILLLVVRMAIIAAVSLAMARPTLLSAPSAGGRGATSAVVILDGSCSMGAKAEGGALLDAARARAREVLDTFERGDEVVLLVPGTTVPVRTEGVRDVDLVRERLDAVAPGGGFGDLAAAVREASASLSDARHPNREIHVLSDFQRSAWDGLGEGGELAEGTALFLLPVGRDPVPENAWIESVDFSGQILEKGSPVEFRTVVASGPGFGPREVEVEFEVDGKVADRRRIDLAPESRVALTFRETFGEDGLHTGLVRLAANDALSEDDERRFSLRTARAVPVMLVAGPGSSARFLTMALAPAGATAGTFAVRTAEPRELASASRERESVVIVADVERLGEEELSGIKRYLSEGGGLVVFPGPATDAAVWGRGFLPRFLPGTFTELRTAEDGFTITRVDASHPLFAVFGEEEGSALAEIRFTRSLVLRPGAGTAVLASYADGNPAILESSLLPGRVLFFTSSPDPAWSDFPLTGTFLPLLHEAVRYLSETGTKAAADVAVGEGASVRVAGAEGAGQVTLTSPSGETRAVALEAGPGGWRLVLPPTDAPGFWTFSSARGDTLAALAANIDARESDLARIDPDEVREALGVKRAAVLEGGATLERELREARLGREVGTFFLWAAAALLAVEMLLAARRPGEGAPPVEDAA